MGKLIGTLSDVLDRGRDAETLATGRPDDARKRPQST
jgi:hypothetical protein